MDQAQVHWERRRPDHLKLVMDQAQVLWEHRSPDHLKLTMDQAQVHWEHRRPDPQSSRWTKLRSAGDVGALTT